jgi:hypothetical protein
VLRSFFLLGDGSVHFALTSRVWLLARSASHFEIVTDRRYADIIAAHGRAFARTCKED